MIVSKRTIAIRRDERRKADTVYKQNYVLVRCGRMSLHCDSLYEYVRSRSGAPLRSERVVNGQISKKARKILSVPPSPPSPRALSLYLYQYL